MRPQSLSTPRLRHPRQLLPVLCAALLAACSTLPERSWPTRRVGEVEVELDLSPDTARLVRIPASDDQLTILDLRTEPAMLAERFVDGQRLLLLPPGDGTARLAMRYRLFDRSPAAVLDAFPDGRVVAHRSHLAPLP